MINSMPIMKIKEQKLNLKNIDSDLKKFQACTDEAVNQDAVSSVNPKDLLPLSY